MRASPRALRWYAEATLPIDTSLACPGIVLREVDTYNIRIPEFSLRTSV